MLSCLLFCLLEWEIFVYKAPNIIYSTLWRQSHQHPGCPDLFIRFLLVLYHKPTTFSRCETKMREHNQTASKSACAFPTPAWAPWPLIAFLPLRKHRFILYQRLVVLSLCSHPQHLLTTHHCSWSGFLQFIPLEKQNLTCWFHDAGTLGFFLTLSPGEWH